ncbi:hypothetical protein FRC03_001113 [Tulasnella sp. 419]|nr:hypothetical protein FRC03_001113 [Tulasnella sp. 419]
MVDIKHLARRLVGADKNPDVHVVSSKDFLKKNSFSPKKFIVDYVLSLFPIIRWITRYNLGWLSGDLVAGLTVGMILIPQSMSYAKIAMLTPEYGLYSSFVGVMVYCFFATSKDVSIGPVAVMSLEVAQVIKHVHAAHPDNDWSNPQIATTLAFICGFIVLGIGMLRVGWIVEFISAPAVAGFMTGSAITILTGQIPGLMGIASRFDTRTSAYKVIINTLKNLKFSTKDAAFGVMGLFALLLIQFGTQWLGKRYPNRARTFFFIGTTRNAFVVLILTLAAWLYAHPRKDAKGNYPINVLKTVPRGFQHVGAPYIDPALLKALAPDLPVATIIMLLEHIAIGKSFGRLNGYKIDPNQELIAMGVTNCVGSVFNAYPATGSFSRTAVKSKSGVRTPIAGVVTGVTVIVALYGLTDAFYWIPTAGLSAVIIAAVADLIAPPSQVYNFWRVNPLECLIWWAAVLVTVFSNVENGIYTSVIASAVLLIIRVARPRGHFLGRVVIHQDDQKETREIYVPMATQHTPAGVLNPHIKVDPPVRGVVIYRPEESVLYPNSSLITGTLADHIKATTKRGKDMTNVPLRNRPWNDPGPRRGKPTLTEEDLAKPLLASVVFDFTAVSHVDTTAVQALMDMRAEIERWTDRPVTFHFCHILSPWIRRALVAGGFGIPADPSGRVHIPFEVAPIVPPSALGVERDADGYVYRDLTKNKKVEDIEEAEIGTAQVQGSPSVSSSRTDFEGSLVSTATPYFHFDLSSAVRAAEADALAANHSRRSSSLDKYDTK